MREATFGIRAGISEIAFGIDHAAAFMIQHALLRSALEAGQTHLCARHRPGEGTASWTHREGKEGKCEGG